VSISVYEHARGCGLRADESEFARVSAVRKEAFAPAQQDRVDDQHNLVDQSLISKTGNTNIRTNSIITLRKEWRVNLKIDSGFKLIKDLKMD
jgi:hypothetical protein